MVRKKVLFFAFCFLGALGCLEFEEKIEVKRNGKVLLVFSLVMTKELFEGRMPQVEKVEVEGDAKIEIVEDKEEKKKRVERMKGEARKRMEKIREEIENVEGVDEVDLEIEENEGGLKATYLVKWKKLKDFQKSYEEVHEKMLNININEMGIGVGQMEMKKEERKRNQNKKFQFSLSEKNGVYSFSFKRLEDKAGPVPVMFTQFFSDKNYIFRFKAPIILETNGKLDKKKGEVFWKVPMTDLLTGKRIDFKVKFRLKEAGSLWLYLAILLVLALGGGAGFFLLRKKG